MLFGDQQVNMVKLNHLCHDKIAPKEITLFHALEPVTVTLPELLVSNIILQCNNLKSGQ